MNRYNRNKAVVLSLFCLASGALLTIPENVAASGRQTPPSPAIPSAAPAGAEHTTAANNEFAYGGKTFNEFIKTSYASVPGSPTPDFYSWFAKAYARTGRAYPGKPKQSLEANLNAIAADYQKAATPEAKAKIEMQAGAWAHRSIKKAIPKFSLQRGFEFRYAVTRGERQCFLQSVLVAGLMQKMGMKAGVVMVSKSEKGQETNNGHAVALVKLSNGHDMLVDVSHPKPTVEQQGIFVADRTSGNYKYVAPTYATNGIITGYRTPEGVVVPADSVSPLDTDFVRSQFDYYRGERTIGGLLAKPSPEGLRKEASLLRRSVEECPRNPLAVYMLGRTYLRMGQIDPACRQLVAANQLYSQAGWVPQGSRDALAMVNRAPRTVSLR